MYRHLLVPLDGSELATNLVTQAVDFARSLGARITFFTARDDLGGTDEGALLRTLAPQDFAEQAAGDANAILAKARSAAGQHDLPCDTVVRTGRRPWELILQVAEERGCDLIFMASHCLRGLRTLVPGSQTQKVLAHARLPVLVATVERNAADDAATAAIGIIRDEHRSIASVLTGLRAAMRQASERGEAPDLDFIAGLLRYMKAFPEVLHHPKEDQFLFAKLAARTHEADDVLAALRREHEAGAAQIAAVEAAVERCRQHAEHVGELAQVIDAFVEAQWRHLNTEEEQILPAARRHLADEDWRMIERAFRDNGDFRVGGEYDESLRKLFARLMNVTASSDN
ncbi:universal stress protein [Aromatoleum evansii]|uniref:Universal stress protein n=1 Tax=Aromatoleum evansii TaxID=59406 RepID=A0ABZ1AT33_AROEV|nr:universal stress protein [Aromatoleum evansii]